MAKLLRIGIVGCGAIGSSLAKIIKKDFRGRAEIAALYDIDTEKSAELARALGYKKIALNSLDKLIDKSGLVIEATHMKFSYNIAKQTLEKSKDILILSVGGIIDKYRQLRRIAEIRKGRLYIPSGAICGLDGLKAASQGKINKVTLTTKKPPAGLGIKGLLKEKVVFEGSAKQAVRYFPQNINVAATLSLAGLGPIKTKVRIVVSPKIKRNIHEIEIESNTGKIFTRTENIPHPGNPKTSFLAVLSAAAALKQILEPVKIGT